MKKTLFQLKQTQHKLNKKTYFLLKNQYYRIYKGFLCTNQLIINFCTASLCNKTLEKSYIDYMFIFIKYVLNN